MAADINFYAGEDFQIYDTGGSGLGFYGASFGRSVAVGSYNARTFITNSNGTIEGPEVDNIKYYSSGSAIVGNSGTPLALTAIPNYKATLNIRFTFDEAVQVSSAEVRIFDRDDIDNAPSGVTCYIAEVIHSGLTQTNNGSGDVTWTNAYGSGSILSLVDSPGTSGFSPSGIDTQDTRHDWYVLLSATPQSIGSKTQFALSVSLEYL